MSIYNLLKRNKERNKSYTQSYLSPAIIFIVDALAVYYLSQFQDICPIFLNQGYMTEIACRLQVFGFPLTIVALSGERTPELIYSS